MKMTDYIRDLSKVYAAIEELDNGALAAKKELKLYVPSRFRDKNLLILADEIYTIGIYMLVVEDKYYAVNLTIGMIKIVPDIVNTVFIDSVEHFEFTFYKGTVFIPNTDIVVRNKLPYYVFNEIVARAKVPVYLSYTDLGNLFNTSDKHATVALGSTITIMHMLIAVISRSPDDLRTYFRQVSDKMSYDKVVYSPIHSSSYGPTNTTARMLGANFSDNVSVALINPSDREENIEKLLKM